MLDQLGEPLCPEITGWRPNRVIGQDVAVFVFLMLARRALFETSTGEGSIKRQPSVSIALPVRLAELVLLPG